MKKRIGILTIFFTVISTMLVIPQIYHATPGIVIVTFLGLLFGSFCMALAVSLFVRMVMKR
ncbi:hypothetical protein [Paenibacillus apiarius]|uniref:Uncharacterized protein n=1 Tax=Paenibacillus apiarius TaxID=46240 RepID=A0ABT4DWP3_9BACL|nr:hypothetical protein [Paenibacillus apiarius]MBN3525874.1 hypothetical protein [Paenibacillus apiarius]MCY9516924.1 hypothetical protein [Paenibacillus apiarius]MCY9521770.1 hypothetical protein [Paenibacillus apiarius]MCY9558704.1 hypothetical protein [Paenibacillus apiarius]MCY9683982.1 hypothetical protein [Paenibacillus apiarius]